MAATVIDYNDIKSELVFLIRNNDVYTITQRGVATTTAGGTWTAATSHLIAVSNVKNIRSITVGGVAIVFGTDYTYNIDYNDSGTIKCKVTLNVATTGVYVITYDYGTDIIFPDFPRTDLTVDSFPRLGLDIIGDDTDDVCLDGAQKEATVTFSVIVIDKKNKDIDTTLKTVRGLIVDNQGSFYYLKYVTRLATSSIGYFGNPRNNLKQRSVDYICPYNIETT